MSDYYKSLISDEEVIKELIKESKRREGKLPTESTRLKPNLNFFQRTVNNLVSNNTRIDKSQDTFKTEYIKDNNAEQSQKSDYDPSYPQKKASIDYVFEKNIVLQTKINFVKSSDTFSSGLNQMNKKIKIKKISSIGGGANLSITKTESNKNMKKNNFNHGIDLISTDSEGSELNNDLILMLNNEERKTTCKSISKKLENSQKCEKTNKNCVIYISSDDTDDNSIEVISRDLEDHKIKNKVRKRKRKKSKDGSHEEHRKKAKRKRCKRNRKEKKK